MPNNNSNSKTQFDNMKYEIAKEVGVNLKQGYNGDLTSREAGKIGGNIVRRVFQSYTGNSYPPERLGDTSR
ncbi:MAG: alpha/beta-type small acid-soluble spore protein [Clostridium sp.]|nr:alpha/beta-type small acid-soluble spore protein [Clostridium sp.]